MREITRILSRVAATCRAVDLPPSAALLVACSGGPDSTGLVDVLVALRHGLGLGRLEIAYVDHRLRPQGALEEAAAVRALGERFALPVHVLDAGAARELERARGASPEAAARVARYGALEALRRERSFDLVAVGHTCSDQAETILLGLAQGGVLRGMPVLRGTILRPLLDVMALELLAYLRARGHVPCYDESNGDLRAPRNLIRLTVLPALRALNPRVEASLAHALRPRPVTPPAGRASRRLDPRPPAPFGEVAITRPGRYELGGETVEIIASPAAGEFDWEALGRPLILRGLRPGDRLRPRGGAGHKTVVRLWRDARVAPASRVGIVVALPDLRGGEVIWAPGLRPSELGRPEGHGLAPGGGSAVRFSVRLLAPLPAESAGKSGGGQVDPSPEPGY